MEEEKKIINYRVKATFLQRDQVCLVLSEFQSTTSDSKIQQLLKDIIEFLNFDEPDILTKLLYISIAGLLTSFQGENLNDLDIVEKFRASCQLVAVALGVDASSEEYKIEELKEKNIDQVDINRLVYTLRFNFRQKESREYIPFFMGLIEIKEWVESEKYSFPKILLITMILFVLWSEYEFMTYDNQEALLQRFFYRSFVLGVPVRNTLSDYLYEYSFDIEEYVIRNAFLIKSLDKNNENIFLENTKVLLLNKLVVEFKSENIKNFTKNKIQNIVREKVNQIEANFPTTWVEESLDVIFHINNADLINKFKDEEKTESDIYDEEMKKLILWLYNRILWTNIIEYLKKDNSRVSFSAFINQLAEHDTLDEENLQRYLDFTQFLKDNKLLSPTQELIDFDEKTGTFEWSEYIKNL